MKQLNKDQAEEIGAALFELLGLKENDKGWVDLSLGDYKLQGLARMVLRVYNDEEFRELLIKDYDIAKTSAKARRA